ncbi:anhydro-N-acetylmuramic acid kinase [Kordia sp. YSTF-M3]|uniref:Anhydro-N-acetylmuramic acid kinase n=1 Tax=Kordia aestuariivivens TaxID=2759037 RepID=A0ABR7QBE6_9FLAO|nr:anhydro-N-acetylmuramic acid kinase [Kordia aestuariivivens]MBC8755676.1 anhydro-N-acetylmuramic acid kinase [Kordia aestuariivivens]
MISYKVIGVMSGTSLDGIDIAHIHFKKQEKWTFSILKAVTIPYSQEMEDSLREAIHFDADQLAEFDTLYTKLLANTIKSFISTHEITKIDAVCSHGHTILHQPENGITYQIGNQEILAALLQQKVVCDFRVQDVELGGQGAPLVPIGDELLFSEYDYCLNLGGFANVSFHEDGKRIAYDICPVNIVLNKYAKQLGFDYDDKGNLAKSGEYLLQLGQELNNLDYYTQQPPKSLGLEWVQEKIFPLLEASQRKQIDVLRTFTEHIAQQIARSFKIRSKILVTGGGAYNEYLLSRIQYYKEVTLVKPSNELLEYKEAVIFGFLGILRLRDEVNCLKSVTGASKNHSSGKIYNLKAN